MIWNAGLKECTEIVESCGVLHVERTSCLLGIGFRYVRAQDFQAQGATAEVVRLVC